MKKSLISIVASTAIAGLVLTGCGSSGGTAANTLLEEVQASVVTTVEPAGLTITSGTTTCVNDENVTAPTGNKLQINAGNMGECSILSQDFNITVDPTLAWTADGVLVSEKIGTTKLKGVKGKKVNIFSTIAVENNQEVEDIDANDDAVKGIKNLLQVALGNGQPIAGMSAALAEVKAIAAGDSNATITAIQGVLTAANLPSLTLEQMKTIEVNVDENGTLTVSSSDENSTLDLTSINNTINAIQTKKILNLNAVFLKVGDSTYQALEDGFEITADAPTIDADSDLDVTVYFSAQNTPVVENATVTLGIYNTSSSNTASLSISNVDVNGKTISLGTDSVVTLTSTASNLITAMGNANTLSKPIQTAMTNTDGQFKLMTVLENLGDVDSQIVTDVKQALVEYLAAGGTYELDLDISGIPTNITTNVPMYGFDGTITLNKENVETPTEPEDGNTTEPEDGNTTEPEDGNTTDCGTDPFGNPIPCA